MKPIRYLLPFLLLCSSAMAQKAIIIELPTGGYLGIAYLADGTQVVLTDVQLLKIPSPVVTPPAPIASGPLTSVVFRVPEKLSVAAAEALIDVRDWVDSQDSKELHHYVFSPDSQDVDGTINQTVKTLHDKMPTGAFYPYAFLTQKSNGKDVIVWQGELKDSAEYIERMKARLK